MKAKYKKRQLNVNLILGVLWMAYFLMQLYFVDELHWTDYGWIVISLAYFGIYVYQKEYKYVTIENGFIIVNGPLGKKIKLNDIKRIKTFAGDYILKTDKKELTINTGSIAESDLAELNTELKKMDISWN